MNTVNNWKLPDLTIESWLKHRLAAAIAYSNGPVNGPLEAGPTSKFTVCSETGSMPVGGTGMEPVGGNGAASGFKPKSETYPNNIPLNRAKNSTRLLYVSAIALKLSQIWQQPPQTIVPELIENLQALCGPDFAVEAAESGMIQFELTDAALAVWLQRIAENFVPLRESRILSAVVGVDRLFPVQYSHARCCSLLRMAHRSRIMAIVTNDRPATGQIWSLIAPNPIPWLDGDKLRLIHPAETNLISELLAVIDRLSPIIEAQKCDKPVDYFKLADRLSAAFGTFYSQCRIWGEVKIETPQLAQARLGLVLATQSLLRFMLEELLNAVAPLEL